MGKYWLGGNKYELTDEQYQEMEAYVAEGKRNEDPEDRGLKWLEDNDCKPVDYVEPKKERKGKASKGNSDVIGIVLLVVVADMVMRIMFPEYSLSAFLPSFSGDEFQHAQLIGPLITGAGVPTNFAARDHCDATILIGDVDTTMPLSGIQVTVDGKAYIDLTGSQPLVNAFAKYMMQLAGSGVVGLSLRIAMGRIDKSTTYKLINNGVTTPNVFAYSQARTVNGKVPAVVSLTTTGVQAGSSEDFKGFSALFITSSANVGSVDMDFKDGHRESGLTVIELDAMLAETIQTEANGRLDPVVTSIDNRLILGKDISNVRVTVPNGGTAVTVAMLKLDESDWARLKQAS